MPRRLLSVWIVLATFVVGGVVAPGLHRVYHNLDRVTEQRRPCHASEVHDTDTSQWTEETVGTDAFSCTLCTVRLLVVPPAPESTAPSHKTGRASVRARSHLTSALVFADRFIRGPPIASEES